MKLEGTNKKLSKIVIDLIEFKIEIYSPYIKKALVLLFDSPSRRFFCSLIALVVIEMKKRSKSFINIKAYTDILSLLDQKLAGKNASDDSVLMFGKIRKAWPRELSDLENASRFKILYRGKFLKLNSEWGNYDYLNDILDTWPSLIGRHEDQSWFYSFDVNQASITLNEVLIIFGQHKDAEAWERFIESLESKREEVTIGEQSFSGLSSLKKDVIKFLSDIENEFKTIKLLSPQNRITLVDQYIPIQVSLVRKYRSELENFLDSRNDVEQTYTFKGQDIDSFHPISWEEAKQSSKKMMVLGNSGMGKSTLLRIETTSLTNGEIKKLTNEESTLEEVIFPLYFRLYDFSQSKGEIFHVILKLVKRQYPKSAGPIENILRNKLDTGNCVLLLDALDEVPRKQRNQLSEKLNRFARNYPCRIICTSRIVGYLGFFLYNAQEVEIVPFNHVQIKNYVETWFKIAADNTNEESISAEGLLWELQNKRKIKELAQNPLLLSLLCSLYQEKKLELPTRRCQIIRKSFEFMLNKRGRKRKFQSEARIEAKISLLEELANYFSCRGQQNFSLRKLLKFTKEYLEDGKSLTHFHDADSIITEFSEDDGILIKLEKGKKRYKFLHRTFQDYLTASYLKEIYDQDKKRGIKSVRNYYWNFDWHEIIALLAGIINNPIPLIMDITERRDDIFQSLLILAGDCIAESEQRSNALNIEVFEKIYKMFIVYPNERSIKSALVNLAKSNSGLLSLLLEIFKNEKSDQKKILTYLLGEIRRDEVIPALVEALSDENQWVQNYAADSLRKFSGPKILQALIDAFHDKERKARMFAAIRLGEIGSSKFIEAAVEALNDKDWEVKFAALWVLEGIGSKKIIPVMIRALSDNNARIRLFATIYLANVGGIEVSKPLIGALQDENREVRMFAALSLGKIGSCSSTKALMQTLQDKEKGVRITAAMSLGAIGSSKAISALMRALQDEEWEVRMFVVGALGASRSREVTKRLIHATIDENEQVRISAVGALSGIDCSYVIYDIMDTIMHSFKSKYWRDRISEISFIERLGNSDGISWLIEYLYQELRGNRINIERNYENLRSPEVIRVLIRAINDECWEVRSFAAIILSAFISREAFPSLIEVLRDKYWEVRLNALCALLEYESDEAITSATLAIRDENENIREIAFDYLKEANSAQAIDVLMEALYDGNTEVRIMAAYTLGYKGCAEAISALTEALNDKSWQVKIAAARALLKLDNDKGIPVISQCLNDESCEIRMLVLRELRGINNAEIIAAIIEALNDDCWEVRKAAAIVITEYGGDEGVPVLTEALSTTDFEFKKFSIKALRRIGEIDILNQIIESSEIDIFDADVFSFARDLAIKFNEEKVDCLPVYPEIVKKFKKK